MNKQNTIHETIIRDIIDIMGDAEDSEIVDYLTNIKANNYKSLASKTSGLTLVFPILTSTNVDIKTATMVAKAQERKAVTMFQILFSAININTERDIFSFLRKYHTNIGTGSMSIEKFIDIMDDLTTEGVISYKDGVSIEEIAKIKEDMRNLNFYMEDNYSDYSLNDYKVNKNFNGFDIIKESPTNPIPSYYDSEYGDPDIDNDNKWNDFNDTMYRYDMDIYNARQRELDHDQDVQIQRDRNAESNRANLEKERMTRQNYKLDREKEDFNKLDKNRKYRLDLAKYDRDHISKMLIDTDVKKANELIPTLMVVRFNQVYSTDTDTNIIPQDVIIGVKAKIYAIPSTEIITRIVNKHRDNNWLLKFVKATTREISFFRDFVFAIDKAKIDAKQSAAKGATAKVFKILERRSSRSKLLRRLGANNTAAAISTIHITKEEVDIIKRDSNIDITKAPVIRKIMESYNLMSFVYSDEATESVSFIYDTGDDFYEVMSFNALEREASDQQTKKIINLMTKMSR